MRCQSVTRAWPGAAKVDRSIADYNQIVKDWQTAGGKQMRKELQDALAANPR